MIEIDENHLQIVQRVLLERVPDYQVFAFGSRCRGAANADTDLDLLIRGKEKIQSEEIFKLIEAFQTSELPFRVDILDWHALNDEFRHVIEKGGYEIIQQGRIETSRPSDS